MSATRVTAAALAARAAADGEFRLAARYWNGSVEFDLGAEKLCLAVRDGHIDASGGATAAGQDIRLVAPSDVWAKILAPVPPPFFNDIMPAAARGLTIEAEPETLWQYYPAVRRLVDLLREEAS